MARASRIRRKDLKRPDEFITLTTRAAVWLREHGQVLTWAGVGLLVACAAGGIFLSFQSARLRDANTELGHAMTALRANELADAATLLSGTAQRWSGTGPGRIAALLAASTELQRDNYESALIQLEHLWPPPAELPIHMRQQLLFLWGTALEGKGDLPGAAEKYASAAEGSGAYNAVAVLGEARVNDALGNTERARTLYRKYLDEFPSVPDREIVQAKLDS